MTTKKYDNTVLKYRCPNEKNYQESVCEEFLGEQTIRTKIPILPAIFLDKRDSESMKLKALREEIEKVARNKNSNQVYFLPTKEFGFGSRGIEAKVKFCKID